MMKKGGLEGRGVGKEARETNKFPQKKKEMKKVPDAIRGEGCEQGCKHP